MQHLIKGVAASNDIDQEISRRLAAERLRLRREAGLVQLQHFRRPQERPFTAAERDKVTILFGGLTWKHDALMRAVFQGCGYRCEMVPTPNVAAFQLGKEYGNNGQCNPTYFTVGNLIQYLQGLEAKGMSRQEIVDNHVFFTAGSCGPCRFGMYEAEYRFGLDNAGFGGFRVLLFQQQDGIKAASGEAGLEFNVDFGMGMLNAFNLGDVMNDVVCQIRPFEVNPGETDRVFQETMDGLVNTLRDRAPFEILEAAPDWAQGFLREPRRLKLKNTLNTLGKIRDHLYGKTYLEAMEEARGRLNRIEVDRTRVKPVVKITGEFWAQITEGDGNFNMFAFLEREGAQVIVEPIATWVTYLLHQAKSNAVNRHWAETHHQRLEWWQVRPRLAHWLKLRKKLLMLSMGEAMWEHFYHRVIKHLGGLTHHLAPQTELARLAHPYYHKLMRGGEGHLEVGKNIYYTANHLCHMVLALKPFGCMPSTQSDGAQSAVVNRYRDMIFLPIETSGEGEVNAHSRVQMALGEAKAKARAEFDTALRSTGKRLEEIQAYAGDHPELRRPFTRVPIRPGIAGTAAQFILHVNGLMEARQRFWPASQIVPRPSAGGSRCEADR